MAGNQRFRLVIGEARLLFVSLLMGFLAVFPPDPALPGPGTDVCLGEEVRIGELLITFTSVGIASTYKRERTSLLGKSVILKSDPDCVFVVISAVGKNVGRGKDGLSFHVSEGQAFQIEGERGYLSRSVPEKSVLGFNLLPEEVAVDELVFQIPADTKPQKLYCHIHGLDFILTWKDSQIRYPRRDGLATESWGELEVQYLRTIHRLYKPEYLTYAGRLKFWWGNLRAKCGFKLDAEAKEYLHGRWDFIYALRCYQCASGRKEQLDLDMSPTEFEAAFNAIQEHVAKGQLELAPRNEEH